MNPDTQIGPIQNKMQYEKVKGFLEDAHAHGKVIAGGKALDRATVISLHRPSCATSRRRAPRAARSKAPAR